MEIVWGANPKLEAQSEALPDPPLGSSSSSFQQKPNIWGFPVFVIYMIPGLLAFQRFPQDIHGGVFFFFFFLLLLLLLHKGNQSSTGGGQDMWITGQRVCVTIGSKGFLSQTMCLGCIPSMDSKSCEQDSVMDLGGSNFTAAASDRTSKEEE